MVSLVIASLCMALIVGTFSTGLLDTSIVKRNTAVEAVIQYEMEIVGAMAFSASAKPYSDCFATEDPSSPAAASSYQGSCPSQVFTLRADVGWQWKPSSTSVQVWTITVVASPSGGSTNHSLQVYKVAHG